jgi:polysaccharide biosynthesis protein PslH
MAETAELKVLVITGDVPSPWGTGDHVANLGLLKTLSGYFRITLLTVGTIDEAEENSTAEALLPILQKYAVGGVHVLKPSRRPRKSWAAAGYRLTRGLITGIPPRYQSHEHPRLSEVIRTTSAECDVVLFLDNAYFLYVGSSSLPTILCMHNVNGASAAEGPIVRGALGRILQHVNLKQIRTVEGRAVSSVQAVTVTSPEEAERLDHLYGVSASAVVPSGVEPPAHGDRRPTKPVVVWVGSYSYGPNATGLTRFVEESWRSVHSATGAELWLIGANPPSEVVARHGLVGVRVLGFVEDLAPVLARASVGVVPLWSGAGVKIKTLTLMAHGVPTVSTTVGMEGIAGGDPPAAVVADTAEELADALVRLLSDKPFAEGIGLRGRELVERQYSSAAVGSIMAQVIRRVALE